ncbi:MAG: (2Fe-2S) ferredoxin domain-containing protein [Hormoscilla sp.]
MAQTETKIVLVCQHTSCRKYGAAKVLAAFQDSPIEGVDVKGVRCLGKCGNGPMVLLLPEEVWYSRVHPGDVPGIIPRHLLPSGDCGNVS